MHRFDNIYVNNEEQQYSKGRCAIDKTLKKEELENIESSIRAIFGYLIPEESARDLEERVSSERGKIKDSILNRMDLYVDSIRKTLLESGDVIDIPNPLNAPPSPQISEIGSFYGTLELIYENLVPASYTNANLDIFIVHRNNLISHSVNRVKSSGRRHKIKLEALPCLSAGLAEFFAEHESSGRIYSGMQDAIQAEA